MKAHFISGLPRSGSTLLAALLRQNPRFHAAMTSPVGGLVERMLEAMSEDNESSVFISHEQKRALILSIFSAYYHPQSEFGGKGDDTMLGSEGDDYLFGNEGSDTICGGAGNDFINGNEQDDILAGCEGNDTIYGGENNDTLTGGKGDDILYGDLGNDSLIGGSGNDIFVLRTRQGFDTIGDFTLGQDLIGLAGGLSFSQLGITQNTQGTLIKNLLTGEELAVMIGVSANAITSANFRLI